MPAGGTETAKGDRRFIIRLQQEMNQFFMWGSARKWQSRACIVRSSGWPKLRPKVGESHEDMFEVGFGHGHRSRRPRFHRRVRLGHAAKRT